VSAAADAARTLYTRFDDAWDGLFWLLARRPEALGVTPLTGQSSPRLYVQEGDIAAGAPEIWIVFKFNNDEVEILAANFVAGDSDPDESF
jgi:hypothetical protein